METSRQEPTGPSLEARGVRALAGIVAPAAYLVFSLASRCRLAEWQSGRFHDRLVLLLSPEAVLPFLPFVLYAMTCMLLLLTSSETFARLFLVRFGVYTGVLLTLQFGLFVGIVLLDFAGCGCQWLPCCVIIAVGGPLALRGLMTWSSEMIGKGETLLVIVVLASGAWGCMVAGGVHPVQAIAVFPMVGIAAVICSAPFWSFAVYAWLAGRLLLGAPTARCGPRVVAGVASWLGGYLAAWRFAVREAHEIYASLPTTPPDCYVATAAARGHSCVVRTWPITTRSGDSFRVNSQMQGLKCAELALMASTPRVHRLCRRAYDTVGPPLATSLHHPLLADLAYLLLKPVEWAALACLYALLPNARDHISRTYQNSKGEHDG